MRPYQNAVYKYVVTTLVDSELHSALELAAANIRPRKTRSTICREALFQYLIRECPAALEKPNAIAAE